MAVMMSLHESSSTVRTCRPAACMRLQPVLSDLFPERWLGDAEQAAGFAQPALALGKACGEELPLSTLQQLDVISWRKPTHGLWRFNMEEGARRRWSLRPLWRPSHPRRER
jgi:hypothetical protein